MTGTSLFDWTIYRHLFSNPRMEEVFGERGTLESWIAVEKAVARAQTKVGIIPQPAADAINDHVNADSIDLERLAADTREVGRPIAGMVRQLTEQVGEEFAQWVHFGITTYDVMDTGKALQLQAGLNQIETAIVRYRDQLVVMAREHRDTVMIGRTNNLHAQPTTFGAKLANWLEELMRHRQRLKELRKRVLVVQFGGAVGTLAAIDPHGLEFREAVAAELGLGVPLSNWHNARDSMTEVSLALGNLCASLARSAQNINALGSTEIGEVSERGEPGRGRSTTMAHKRNPRAAEFAEAVARLGRQRAMGLPEVMGQDHDRCGGTYIAEWMLVPEVFLLTSGALMWATDLFGRLDVQADRMRANIDMTAGLVMTERFTMALAKKTDKRQARQLLDEACAKVAANGGTLADALKEDPAVREHLSEAGITELTDPRSYTGAAGDIVDDVLAALAAEKE